MNYSNFEYDLNNVFSYYEYKLCLDQVLYSFNDKYNQLEKSVYYMYFKKFIDLNNHNKFINQKILKLFNILL